MHEPRIQLPGGLQEDERAKHIGAHEVLRPENRTVDVRLCREVDDRVHGAELVDLLPHRDVPTVALQVGGQVRRVARVRELVEDDDVLAGGEHPFDEVRADEAGSAGD